MPNYTVVPVSYKTGKVLKRVKKGQLVNYAIQGPRGGVKLIRPEPQKYFKTDLLGLKRSIKSKNFVVYEQKLRKLKRVDGKIQKYKDGNKIYETKITFGKSWVKQKPVLYKNNKKLRSLDLGYKKSGYHALKDVRAVTLIRPNAPVYHQLLKGKTIIDALSNLQLDVGMKELKSKEFAFYYNIMAVIDKPDGSYIKIPVNSFFKDNEFTETNEIGKQLFGKNEITRLANLKTSMGKAIRYAFKNADAGYTFSSLLTLENIEAKEKSALKKIENNLPKLYDKYMQNMFNESKSEKIKKEIEAQEKIASQKVDGLNHLYFKPGMKKQLFINKDTKLTLLDKGYSVTLYVKFEKLYAT